MKKRLGALVLLSLLALSLLSGCYTSRGLSALPLDTESKVQVGKMFLLRVRNTGTFEHKWEYRITGDADSIKFVDSMIDRGSPIMGYMGRNEFIFEAVAPGKVHIEMRFCKQWDDPDREPLMQAFFDIVIP